jgi:hypothetical protein
MYVLLETIGPTFRVHSFRHSFIPAIPLSALLRRQRPTSWQKPKAGRFNSELNNSNLVDGLANSESTKQRGGQKEKGRML